MEGFSLKRPNEHANIVINPCTHHPLVLYRETDGGGVDSVRVRALDTMTGDDLVPTDKTEIDTVKFDRNTKCGDSAGCPSGSKICKCGGADAADCSADGVGGCVDIAGRVHGAAVRFSGGTCLLYAAYDYSAVASDGETYMKSKMKIIFLDGDTPVKIGEVISSEDDVPQNEWSGVALADQFTGRAGFFFYRQVDGDACDTRYIGKLSQNGLSFTDEEEISDTFPTIKFNAGGGMGHYVEGTRFTEPGVLFPSWSQPVETAVPCQACLVQDYSMVVMGSKVSP